MVCFSCFSDATIGVVCTLTSAFLEIRDIALAANQLLLNLISADDDRVTDADFLAEAGVSPSPEPKSPVTKREPASGETTPTGDDSAGGDGEGVEKPPDYSESKSNNILGCSFEVLCIS